MLTNLQPIFEQEEKRKAERSRPPRMEGGMTPQNIASIHDLIGSNNQGYQANPDNSDAENNYMSKLDATKTRLGKVAPFLMGKPEKPQLDSERMGQYKNLSKAAMFAQMFDALGDALIGSRNSEYRPVASSAFQAGQFGADQVFSMDREHQQQLQGYKDEVFRIDEQNKATEQQLWDRNKQVDLAMAETQMGFDQGRKKAEYDQAKLDQDQRTKDPRVQAALRLIAQGEEEAGVVLLQALGWDMADIQDYLGKGKPESGSDATLNRINSWMGYGEGDKGITNAELHALRNYHKIRKELSGVDEKGNPIEGFDRDRHYSPLDGSPISQQAKDLERYEKKLGLLIDLPEEYLIENATKKATGRIGGGSEDDVVVDPTHNASDGTQIGNPASSTNMSQQLGQQATKYLKMLNDAQSDEERVNIVQDWMMQAEGLGMTPEQVQGDVGEIFDPESAWNQYVGSQQQLAEQAQADNAQRNTPRYKAVVDAIGIEPFDINDMSGVDPNSLQLAISRFGKLAQKIADPGTNPQEREQTKKLIQQAAKMFNVSDAELEEILAKEQQTYDQNSKYTRSNPMQTAGIPGGSIRR